jgi:hypothetical protein
MNMKNVAFAAAAVFILSVPHARAQQAPDSTSALAQAPAPEQQRHQRIFGTTPDLTCIDGACSRKPATSSQTKAPAQAPASNPASTPAAAGPKAP